MTTEMVNKDDHMLKEDRVYTDRISGDRLLIGPGEGRESRMIVHGLFMAVKSELVGYDRMMGEMNALVEGKGRKYEGPDGKIVIDIVSRNQLLKLPTPDKTKLIDYLSHYKKLLIPYLEEDRKVSREEIANFETNFGAAVDYLVGLLEKDLLRLFIGLNTYVRNLKGSMVFGHWEEGKNKAPTLLYFAHGLKSDLLFPELHHQLRNLAVDTSESPATSNTSESPATSRKRRRKKANRKTERVLELQLPTHYETPSSDAVQTLPPGFKMEFFNAVSKADDQLLHSLATRHENGIGPGKVYYAKLKNEDGDTALHIAAATGDTFVFKYLTQNLKFNSNITNDKGETPLFPAIRGGHLRTIALLIEELADVTKVDANGITPLHCAAENGSPEIMKLLMSEGANIKANAQAGTPLHFAALGGNVDTLKFLLCDLKLDPNCIGAKGITPLHYAAEKGSPEIMKFLMSAGADFKAEAYAGTLLHFAASGGNADTLKFLLCDLKLDPNFISQLGLTPLQMATSARSIECAGMLLQAGADPNADCFQSQITPLCIAVSDQDVGMIRLLIDCGANPDMTDITGKKALEYAALKGYSEVVELLFPITSVAACYPEWSICGIMKYEQSKKAKDQRKFKVMKLIQLARDRAKEACKRKDYFMVMRLYTHVVEVSDRTDAKVQSYRSLCWTVTNEGKAAFSDAKTCVRLEPPCWAEGKHLDGLKRYQEEAFCALASYFGLPRVVTK